MNKIKEARLSLGWSQQKMSNETGIPKRTIENWDANKSNPTPWQERLILKELNEFKEKVMGTMKHIELTEKDFEGINEMTFREVGKKFNITPAAAKSMVGDYNSNGFSNNLSFYVNTPQNLVANTKGEYRIG